eukprot:CAMPEP_0198278726 /NCGR_PEP_ID=MMETSP1447-20131203/66529_1 /TAXON_ID=420782 /ORGANISM="Chaetoceros dichaeta, Strain CCMP1751" /LENGTH=384 /DNA_ID=CAMNT_0043973821 /DNA_START=107 /DNA_END=1261 /DNA_ORIENTATION=-
MLKYTQSTILLIALALQSEAFTVPHPQRTGSFTANTLHTSTSLYNVPPMPTDGDSADIKDASDREGPPQSFFQLQINCARAAELAIRDGYKLLEVEFPPLPAQMLEMDDVSAYNVAEANLNLAVDFAKSFAAKPPQGDDVEVKMPRSVAILFPDEAEANIIVEKSGGNFNPSRGVTISSLRPGDPNDKRLFKPEQTFLSLFRKGSGGLVKPIEGVEMYVIVVASAQELPDVEELHTLAPDAIIVFYNLKLDVLRGDIGAPAFPSKDFQDRFLSLVKPVYYLRTRQYSRSTASPPYMVAFQGCLFRSYPGQFQTLLDTGTGDYRRVVGADMRPPLGTFKEQLTQALQTEGVIEQEGKVLDFLRTGYKTTTWWEDEREDASDEWRT